MSPRPVSETSPNGSASYNLEEWVASGQDAGARLRNQVLMLPS